MPGRQRQHHMRSRTGCAACRARHVRCNEKRPICTKCLVTGSSCVYPPVERWISETGEGSVAGTSRPNFVGAGRWNAVWQLPKDPRTMDPFDSLPVHMSSKSYELLRYFLRASSPKDSATPMGKQFIGKVTDNPMPFRGVLLLASLHYYWNTGHLGEYASTYYTHKINWIRSVNAYLGGTDLDDHAKFRAYLNIVGTLALIETSMGDHNAARAHLVGLSMLSERFQSIRPKNLTALDAVNLPTTLGHSADDHIQLYLALLTQDVIEGTSEALSPAFPQQAGSPSQPEILRECEQRSPSGRLALWLVTYFLMASYNISGEYFDLRDLLDYLRLVTTAHSGCCHSPSFPAVTTTKSQRKTQARQSPSPFNTTIPWGSTVAAGGAYMHCILGLPWAYVPSAERGPLFYLIPAIRQDVAASETAIAGSRIAIGLLTEGARLGQALWLWKVVIGACTLMSAQKVGLPAPEPEGMGSELYDQEVVSGARRRDDCSLDGDNDELYAMLLEWWARRLRRWSKATGISEWNDVRNFLALVAWPDKGSGMRLAEEVWENAVNKPVTI